MNITWGFKLADLPPDAEENDVFILKDEAEWGLYSDVYVFNGHSWARCSEPYQSSLGSVKNGK